jgi:hypothetical protein
MLRLQSFLLLRYMALLHDHEHNDYMHEKVANQSNSELSSSSPTQSPEPPHIQIDVQIAYDLRFGRSTYA